MSTPAPNLFAYGKASPLPEQIPLSAGPLTMIYENGDLRYIKLGEHEVVRRLYVAIRDRNWNTAANVLSDIQMEIDEDHFQIHYRCTNQLADIDLSWQGTLIGGADGTISCTMRGEAQSTFQRNRIGFCLLHPSTIAGVNGRITHIDGTTEEQPFPLHIAPQLVVDGIIKPVAPFEEMQAVAHEVTPGVWAEVAFAGETFEMEDQRNWTDASYKTYGTPLRLPFPVTVDKGTKIEQAVTIRVRNHQQAMVNQQGATEQNAVSVTIGTKRTALPKIGLGVASHGAALEAEEIRRLQPLHLAHLRVDLTLADAGYPAALQRATTEARALDIALEIAVHPSENAAQELATLAQELPKINPPVARWLIFTKAEKTTTASWVTMARQQLSAYDATVPIGAGTNLYFTELNSKRPPIDVLDVVAYSLNPQVHAFDNASLVETLAAQATTATSARHFCGDRPLVVSPITLQPRFNPNATGPEAEAAAGTLPTQVDPRQLSLFGAGWTLGSIKYLAETGEIEHITYYETTGWRGVMETRQGSPLPALFPSIAGALFPLYHLLADVGAFAGGTVVQSISSAPLQVEGLVLEKAGRQRVLLANFTAQEQEVTLQGLTGTGRIRQLDESNVIHAMREPEAYRAAAAGGSHTAQAALILPPYATICFDL